jgi:tight adherence protein C
MPVAALGFPLAMSIAVLLIFQGLAHRRRPDEIKKRLQGFGERTPTLEELELSQPFIDRVIRPTVLALAKFTSHWAPKQSVERIRESLMVAGHPGNLHAPEFVGIKGLAGVVMLILVALLLIALRVSLPIMVLLSAAFGGIGYFLPTVWLGQKVKTRKKAVRKNMPDAIDLLTISVEAGLGFDGAMQRVSEKWNNALSDEFGRVLAEMHVGKSRREALREMVNRTKVEELSNFVAAIIQADQLGVSIAKVLRIQSDQMRIFRRQRAQESAQKAPLKVLFPLVFFIFPSLFIIILGPAVPKLFGLFFAH